MADYSIAISVKPTGLNETIKSLSTFEKIAEKSVQTAEALAVSLTKLSKIDLSQYKTLFASAIANAQSLTKETGNVIHNLHSMTDELNRSTEATGRLNDTAGNVSVNIKKTQKI